MNYIHTNENEKNYKTILQKAIEYCDIDVLTIDKITEYYDTKEWITRNKNCRNLVVTEVMFGFEPWVDNHKT